MGPVAINAVAINTSISGFINNLINNFIKSIMPLKSEGGITVIVDSRELRSKAVKTLYERGVHIKSKRLEVADFVVSDRVAIERKTLKDFESSIIDGRLFKQCEELIDNYERPVIIIEGDSLLSSRLHPNAVRGALASVTTDFGIPVIIVDDGVETALLIIAYARREQLKIKRPIIYGAKRKKLTDSDFMEAVIASFPNIGAQIAINLLKRFKTLKKILSAKEEKLMKVDKVGPVIAKRLIELINKEYEKN